MICFAVVQALPSGLIHVHKTPCLPLLRSKMLHPSVQSNCSSDIVALVCLVSCLVPVPSENDMLLAQDFCFCAFSWKWDWETPQCRQIGRVLKCAYAVYVMQQSLPVLH
jgi:hypothetical protein